MLFLKVLSNPEAGNDIAITRLVIYVKSKLYSPLLNLTFYPDTNSLKKFIFFFLYIFYFLINVKLLSSIPTINNVITTKQILF